LSSGSILNRVDFELISEFLIIGTTFLYISLYSLSSAIKLYSTFFRFIFGIFSLNSTSFVSALFSKMFFDNLLSKISSFVVVSISLSFVVIFKSFPLLFITLV